MAATHRRCRCGSEGLDKAAWIGDSRPREEASLNFNSTPAFWLTTSYPSAAFATSYVHLFRPLEQFKNSSNFRKAMFPNCASPSATRKIGNGWRKWSNRKSNNATRRRGWLKSTPTPSARTRTGWGSCGIWSVSLNTSAIAVAQLTVE